ncbi:uncharacterized protein GIQ15_03661 [Arthroderma uncinatum]|uniref:uncharacterized protein n=1 Tax=Arthroderma uncinatum TaxID=74035 RepID=UPI00144AA788|nr:uncharacterized protein GIQ15_03661 [Arthroderma uncinatum]KAF3484337.1 hypothetical protein GIQ15_03661 [Arthroderma uncinatum]
MFSSGWLTQCLGAQLESPSALPPPTQDNDTSNSNNRGAEAARLYSLVSQIAQCLGARRKKSSFVPAQPPGDRLFPHDVRAVIQIYGEDIEHPRLRVRTRTGDIKDGYCTLGDLPQMREVWAAYSQWEGKKRTPKIERLIPKYPLRLGRKLISDPTSVHVEAYGGMVEEMVDGGYPVLAVVRLEGKEYSESVCLSSVDVFLESKGAEKATEPCDWRVLLRYWGKEVYPGVP